MSVGYEVDGPVVIVTIDRTRVRNAVDAPTAAALAAAFHRFDSDDKLSVAVLAGAGGNFCAGFDLKALATGSGNTVEAAGDGPMGPTRMNLDKPVIAAIEGYAVAGGLELALWCDLRVAARDATLGVFNRRFGVPLVDLGTIRLPRMVGQGRALDLILTGRPVGAEEALRIGLLERLVEHGAALSEAVKLAHEISLFPQGSLRVDRRSVLNQWGLNLDEAMREEFDGAAVVLSSGESQAGARRFVDGTGRHGSGTGSADSSEPGRVD